MADRALLAELLDRPLPAALTTLDADGAPRSVVVWCDREGDLVTVNAGESVWLQNLRRDPRLALVVHDDTNILRYAALRGRAIEIAPDHDYDHIDRLSRLYEDRAYPYEDPAQAPRFKVTIEPAGLRTLDEPRPPGGGR
jgi:PPOX class probable F420-dependent enzyme